MLLYKILLLKFANNDFYYIKLFLNIILLSFSLSLPALFYLYQLINNINFLSYISDRVYINYLSNLIVILSIFLFYTFPFILFKIPEILKYHELRNL